MLGQEAQMAKWVSLIVKFGALVFIIFVPTKFAIYLQLLGGILIIQTLPAVMLGVYTRRAVAGESMPPHYDETVASDYRA
jgi:Na+/proline symporter